METVFISGDSDLDLVRIAQEMYEDNAKRIRDGQDLDDLGWSMGWATKDRENNTGTFCAFSYKEKAGTCYRIKMQRLKAFSRLLEVHWDQLRKLERRFPREKFVDLSAELGQ